MKIQIIYFNGPSSSGKTTLSKALQDALDPPFLHIGIDKVIGMMPEKVNNWKGGLASLGGFYWKESKDTEGNVTQDIQTGPFAKQVVLAYQEIVLLLARLGHFLIIDDVSLGQAEVQQWKQKLREFSVCWIGVHASLEELERREKERGNRIIGSARAQFFKVHQDVTYDLEINTSTQSITQCTETILKTLKNNQKVNP